MPENSELRLLALLTDPDLVRTIEQQIDQRTGGGIRDLRLDVSADRVVVRGYTAKYYLRQLALVAAEQALGIIDSGLIELDITVVDLNGSPHSSRSGASTGGTLRSE